MVEVRLNAVRVDLSSNTPVVLLQEAEGNRTLPIFIGAPEATAMNAGKLLRFWGTIFFFGLTLAGLGRPAMAATFYWNGVGSGWDSTADWSTAAGATKASTSATRSS